MATAQVLASLLQRPETMAAIQQILGASETASLNAKAADLLEAVEVRANLAQRLGNEQQTLRQEQERAAAERAEQERRIEAREELARRVVTNAIMGAELDHEYARTTIVGYRLKASETRSSLGRKSFKTARFRRSFGRTCKTNTTDCCRLCGNPRPTKCSLSSVRSKPALRTDQL